MAWVYGAISSKQNMKAVLQCIDLEKKFGGKQQLQVLRKVNLTVNSGESAAIVGASGSGKTSLLSLLAGLDLPSSGQILLNGQDITAMDEESRCRLRAEQVGFIFQSFELLPSMTALENVMLPLELKGAANARGQALQWLASVNLEQRAHHYPQQLSGGEQQRVGIARAFVTRPQILFADEPTGNLDESTGADISAMLLDLGQNSDSIMVLVTHDNQLASRCSRSYKLAGGELAEMETQ